MKTKKPPKLKTWSKFKQERFKKSPGEAIEYLKASLEENSDTPELAIAAIRSVSRTIIQKIAKAHQLSEMFKITPARGMESVIKAQLIAGVMNAVSKTGVTHQELATRSGLSRSTVTGILNGSLRKVTIDRVLRLVESVGLVAKIKLKQV